MGDSYYHDVVGAHSAGMVAAYLTRGDVTDKKYPEMFAKYNISPDITLTSLDPSEVCGKIEVFINACSDKKP